MSGDNNRWVGISPLIKGAALRWVCSSFRKTLLSARKSPLIAYKLHILSGDIPSCKRLSSKFVRWENLSWEGISPLITYKLHILSGDIPSHKRLSSYISVFIPGKKICHERGYCRSPAIVLAHLSSCPSSSSFCLHSFFIFFLLLFLLHPLVFHLPPPSSNSISSSNPNLTY